VISPIAAIEMAVVKIEVKRSPEKKLPRISLVWV
jgi:hypothetical protein